MIRNWISPLNVQEHQTLVSKSRREVMEEVVGICESWLTYEGLFFNVEVHTHTQGRVESWHMHSNIAISAWSHPNLPAATMSGYSCMQLLVQTLPWKKVKHRILGVNHQGLIEVDPKTGEVGSRPSICMLLSWAHTNINHTFVFPSCFCPQLPLSPSLNIYLPPSLPLSLSVLLYLYNVILFYRLHLFTDSQISMMDVLLQTSCTL